MQYFSGLFYQETPNASVTDLTPPTFAGIDSVSDRPNGSLRVQWLAATDSTTPIRYEIYVQASTATGLFNTANIALVSNSLSQDVYQLANGSNLIKGTVYHVGVRAVDAVGNRDSNLVSLSETSVGVLDDDLATIAASLAATQVSFAATQASLAVSEASLAVSAPSIAADADRIENAANLLLSTVL